MLLPDVARLLTVKLVPAITAREADALHVLSWAFSGSRNPSQYVRTRHGFLAVISRLLSERSEQLTGFGQFAKRERKE